MTRRIRTGVVPDEPMKVDKQRGKDGRYQAPFTVMAADLSLHRPGFALLAVQKDGTVRLLEKLHVKSTAGSVHGCTLEGIYGILAGLVARGDVLVRERAFTRFSRETQALFKVVGIADLAAWRAGRKVFAEVPPKTVKKLQTGNGNASKEEVAQRLADYVGSQEYACDDESDAVAIGIAWLIENGFTRRVDDG